MIGNPLEQCNLSNHESQTFLRLWLVDEQLNALEKEASQIIVTTQPGSAANYDWLLGKYENNPIAAAKFLDAMRKFAFGDDLNVINEIEED
jgi:hypothetical protein